MMYEFRVVVVDSQYRQKVPKPEFGISQNRHCPWEFTGISEVLNGMSNAGWEHYESLEITDPMLLNDFYSKHGTMLFFRRQKQY